MVNAELPANISSPDGHAVFQDANVDYGIRFVQAGLVTGEVNRYIGAGSIRVLNGGKAHNNLQPYISVYMWRRTN